MVRHFGIGRIDIVGQRDGSLEPTERAFHQVVEASLVMFGGPLFTTDTYAASIYRDIDVFLPYAGHFDFNDDRLRRFPRFTRQQRPLRKVLVRAGTAFSLRTTSEMSQRAAAANEYLAPPLGEGFPGTRDTSLQF